MMLTDFKKFSISIYIPIFFTNDDMDRSKKKKKKKKKKGKNCVFTITWKQRRKNKLSIFH